MSKLVFIKQFIKFCAVTPPMVVIFGGGLMIILGNLLDNDSLRDQAVIVLLVGLFLLIGWIIGVYRYSKNELNESL